MKKLLLLLCLAALACQRVPKDEFLIEGRLREVEDGTVISLYEYEGNLGLGVDTATVAGGKFSFRYHLTSNTKLSLGGPYDNPEFPSMGREIWAVPGGKAVVRGNNTLIFTWDVKSKVPQQAEADRYMLKSREEYNRVQMLSIEENKAKLSGIDKKQKRKSIDSLRYLRDEVDIAIFRNNISVMDETPVSEIWLDELLGLSTMIKHYERFSALRDDAIRLYDKIPDEDKANPLAEEIRINLWPPEKVGPGDMMADSRLKDPEGNYHRLSDYKGKYIVLDFWASGCGACVHSMPILREIYEKYGSVMTLIGINIDTSEEGWRKGTEMWNPAGLNLNAPQGNDIKDRYGVNAIPHYVLISPDGIIIDSWSEYRDRQYIEILLDGMLGK